ncbi:hypothetical protein Anapl_02010 [Anas platyrhynchos]|uniref:Uncharacterized protein n=1 Tax=Anas platyrhynchos TaxID=8839 RepID=R0KAZ3_ANAPL|nr:hypothetical protein Anapl_02010 [Anas platyrhynchos]
MTSAHHSPHGNQMPSSSSGFFLDHTGPPKATEPHLTVDHPGAMQCFYGYGIAVPSQASSSFCPAGPLKQEQALKERRRKPYLFLEPTLSSELSVTDSGSCWKKHIFRKVPTSNRRDFTAPQNSDLDPLPGNPISVHFTSSSFNRAHKQTNKLMLQTQWKPYQKGDAVPKPNLNPPSLEQKASANKCRAAQASTEQRETNQGCCSDALSWGRAIRPLAAFCLAQRLLSSVTTLPVKAGPGYHALKISRPPTGSPPFFSVIICLFVLVFTFDMLSAAIRASPSADGLDERSSFDLPKPAWPFLPDKDTEGCTGTAVQYLPVCLGQMFDAVTAPSYTGRMFGPRTPLCNLAREGDVRVLHQPVEINPRFPILVTCYTALRLIHSSLGGSRYMGVQHAKGRSFDKHLTSASVAAGDVKGGQGRVPPAQKAVTARRGTNHGVFVPLLEHLDLETNSRCHLRDTVCVFGYRRPTNGGLSMPGGPLEQSVACKRAFLSGAQWFGGFYTFSTRGRVQTRCLCPAITAFTSQRAGTGQEHGFLQAEGHEVWIPGYRIGCTVFTLRICCGTKDSHPSSQKLWKNSYLLMEQVLIFRGRLDALNICFRDNNSLMDFAHRQSSSPAAACTYKRYRPVLQKPAQDYGLARVDPLPGRPEQESSWLVQAAEDARRGIPPQKKGDCFWCYGSYSDAMLRSVSATEELRKTLSGPSSEMKEMETPIEFQCSPSLQEELYHWKSSGPQLGKK